MAKVNILLGFGLIALVMGCDSGRHEMPITTSSEEARELYFEARYWNENFDPLTADSFLYQALELDPNFALAHMMLYNIKGASRAKQLIDRVSTGEALMIKAWSAVLDRDYKLGEELVDSLLMLYPKDKHCLYFACVVAREEVKGVEYLNQAIKVDRYYAAAYLRAGICYMVLNDYVAAKEHYQRYIDLTPNSGFGLHSYAGLLQRSGQEDEALEQLLTAIRVDPSYSDPYLQVIWLYYRRDEIDLVWKYSDLYYNVTRLQRTKNDALFWKANVMLIRNDLEAALHILDQIIQSSIEDDNHRNAMYMRYYEGWFALRSGEYDLSLSIFTSLLEMLSQVEVRGLDKTGLQMWTLGCLSILHGETKDTVKAGEFLNKSREVFVARNYPADSSTISLYEGVYYLNTGNYDLAFSHLNNLKNRYHHTSQYYLAEAYRLLGQKEEAIVHYRKAMNKDYHLVNHYTAALFYNKSEEWLKKLENE